MQIWCAATASSLMRDAIAVAVRSATISDAVRTTRRLPTVALARMPAGRGRTDAPARRTARPTITRYATAAPYCASTVPHAEPSMPEVEAVHEEQLDQEVGDVGGDRDHEGRARVLHPAEVAGAREREQQRGRTEDADAEVGDRVRGDVGRRAHHVDDRGRERETERR